MKMSKSQKCSLILWGLAWSAIALGATPTIASETEANKIASARASTKAQDLLSPGIELSKYFTDLDTRTYQLGQLNLEKFCQDFPYNSKCRDANTSPTESNPIEMETEPDSIPVPVPPPAPSEDIESSTTKQKSGWAIVPEISTLGLGGHVVRRIIPQVNARVGVNAFGLDLDGAIDTDVDYEANLNLFNVSTLADIHPFKSSGFRISTGLVFSNNNFDGSGDLSQLVIDELQDRDELDDDTIARLEEIDNLATVDAEVDISNSVSPYLGIGGGNAVAKGKGFGFWWNLGVIFSGMPQINLSTDVDSDRILDELDESGDSDEAQEILEETQAAADEATEEQEDDIQDALDFVNIYPVLSLGISYQF